MKGLDAWIMGLNDPNAPFNQTDWIDTYEPILDKCEWITDDMIENDDCYQKLGDIFHKVFSDYVGNKFIPKNELRKFMVENATNISTLIKTKFNELEK